ncbi:sulfatase [Thalassoglobus sp. JC818]|uniref:sulfatase n=1 Tax=Thalassoglobus sp. JC818 TaxID=3232136 RepID=UPI003457F158
MNRLYLILIGLIFIPFQAERVQGADQPPNILLILIDDMGWADLQCYGSQFHETPNIDRLASEGVRFTDFYSAGAVCSPTRAAIQSGQYQARLGITDFIPGHRRPFAPLLVPEVANHLPLEIVTPAEALHEEGYATGYFGKWHLGNQQQEPDSQGYDVSLVTGGRHFAPNFRTNPPVEVPDETYLADFLTDQTIDFMRDHKDEPFFAMLSHYAVHIPLEAKKEKIAKYEKKPKPEGGVNNPIYAAMVEHVDDSVAQLMKALDELELAENTVVIFTSDNGGLYQSASRGGPIVCSNAPLRDEKGTLYEGGIRVPLIVRWPGVAPAGAVCSDPTISTDFWPTLAEIGGVKDVEHQTLDGVSLVPVLKNPEATLQRDAIYFHFPHYHHSRPAGSIRMGDWKLIEFFEQGDLELYNLADDLSETKNLLAESNQSAANSIRLKTRAHRMQQQLREWRESIDAQMPQPNPNHDPERELEIRKRNR